MGEESPSFKFLQFAKRGEKWANIRIHEGGVQIGAVEVMVYPLFSPTVFFVKYMKRVVVCTISVLWLGVKIVFFFLCFLRALCVIALALGCAIVEYLLWGCAAWSAVLARLQSYTDTKNAFLSVSNYVVGYG